MRQSHNIVLFTESYPYASITEEVFIVPDVIALSKKFDKVYIIPLVKSGQLLELPDLPNVFVDTSLACNKLQHSRLKKSILSFHPFVLYHSFRNLFEAKSIKQWLKGHYYNINCISISSIVKKVLRKYNLTPDNTLLYTFWFLNTTTALSRLSQNTNHWKIVSRAHNHDIYENHTHNVFISPHLRNWTLKHVDYIYPVSNAAEIYLKEKYPLYHNKIRLNRIGSTKLFKHINPTYDNMCNEFTILSVSRVVHIKRVDLNLELVKQLALLNPSKHFKWIHIGDGESISELKTAVNKTRLTNLTIELKGKLNNIDVQKLYVSTHIDLFILLSSIEGLPIAICEAMSYSIPVAATDVGGNNEIISNENGFFVNPDDIYSAAKKITEIINNPQQIKFMRQAAYNTWHSQYCADKLRLEFANNLRMLESSN